MGLSYTLVNLAFGVPMSRRFGHGGFMVYWLLNTCTMGAGMWPLSDVLSRILTGPSWLADGIAFHDHWVEVGRVLPQLL
jgi:hypothetical protein